MKYTTEEIKGLLEGITPGEWEYGSDSELVYTGCDGAGLVIGRARELVDRKFIAAAPTIIRDLLAEVERYKRKHSEMGGGSGCPPNGDCGGDDWTCKKCWEKYWEEE